MLEVKNLCKIYQTFRLDGLSLKLEPGYIMGFVGKNGAGKSTALKSLLNIVLRDSGNVTIFGKPIDHNEKEIKQDVGFVVDDFHYYQRRRVKTVTDVYKRFYSNWDEPTYRKLLKKFSLDEKKKISELSTGMKVKYALALAMSHRAKLFLFDEPTSGLDPVSRDELLDLFREIIADGDKSVLFSTHITSDLDKCADYILMIDEGKTILNATKDEIVDTHFYISGKKKDFTDDLRCRMIAYKEHVYGFNGLIKTADLKDSDAVEKERPNLEEIMIYYIKEHSHESINL